MSDAAELAEREGLVRRLNAVSAGYTLASLGADLSVARDFVAELERGAELRRRLGVTAARRALENETFAEMERLGISDTE